MQEGVLALSMLPMVLASFLEREKFFEKISEQLQFICLLSLGAGQISWCQALIRRVSKEAPSMLQRY